MKPLDQPNARLAMLTLQRMLWRTDFSQNVWANDLGVWATDLGDIIEVQDPDAKKLTTAMLHFTTKTITRNYNFHLKGDSFITRYNQASLTGPDSMAGEEVLKKFVLEAGRGMALYACLRWGSTMMLQGLVSGVPPGPKNGLAEMLGYLDRRLEADKAGLGFKREEIDGVLLDLADRIKLWEEYVVS